MKIKMYVLTHKKFDFERNEIYEPLLTGSAWLDDDFGYLRDDTGENISKLNHYYSELAGQYWVWKNSDADIIGFCHYRRYFAKNIFLDMLDKKTIEKILGKYDIILPQKKYNDVSNIGEIERVSVERNTNEDPEHYILLRKIIEEKYPEYLDTYDEFLNDNKIHYYNMFISNRSIADGYFSWVFDILEEFREQYDFSKYPDENNRILGYLSERLLNVYVRKHSLKVKEKIVFNTELRFPLVYILEFRFVFVQKILRFIVNKGLF